MALYLEFLGNYQSHIMLANLYSSSTTAVAVLFLAAAHAVPAKSRDKIHTP